MVHFLQHLIYTCTSQGTLALLGVPFLWSFSLIRYNLKLKSLGLGRWPVDLTLHMCQFWYTWKLETESSVTVTFTLFLNAQLTFTSSPIKYPYCVLHCLLLSHTILCRFDDVVEIYYNVGAVFTEKEAHHCLLISMSHWKNQFLN